MSQLHHNVDYANSHANQVYWTFTRDRAGGIAKQSLGTASYSYDGFSSVNRSYTTNGLNQYTAASSAGGSHAFAYDTKGDLQSDTVSGSSLSYGHDALDELISANVGHGNVSLAYDGLGRLAKVTDGAGAVTRYLWDGGDLIAEYDGSPTPVLLRSYVHGPGVDEPIAWYEGSSVDYAHRRYVYPDVRGSVTTVTDASGNTIHVNSYDEHGVPGSGNIGTFQYTGQLWLPAVGAYSYKARTYSPTLGRFMEKDPSGYNGGINLYAYGHGNPVNLVDPSGLMSVGECEALQDAAKNQNSQEIVVCGGGGGGEATGADGGAPGDIVVTGTPQPPPIDSGPEIVVTGTSAYWPPQNGDAQEILVMGSKGHVPHPVNLTDLRPSTFYLHFLNGTGDPVVLTAAQFGAVATAGIAVGKAVKLSNGNSVQLRSYYGTSYQYTFGSAFVTSNGAGTPIGFNDFYNFDFHAREFFFSGQGMTALGAFGYPIGGRDFAISYP